MPDREMPLAIYIPEGLDSIERRDWCHAVIADLIRVGAADQRESGAWEGLLDAAAAELFPDGVSGAALLVSTAQPPTFLWVTMAQPAGEPTRLGDAVLDTQLAGHSEPPPSTATSGQVYQRTRTGWAEQPDGPPVLLQTNVTATTLKLPGLGVTDVCLWFNSIDPTGADELKPAVAEIALSGDLLTYLST